MPSLKVPRSRRIHVCIMPVTFAWFSFGSPRTPPTIASHIHVPPPLKRGCQTLLASSFRARRPRAARLLDYVGKQLIEGNGKLRSEQFGETDSSRGRCAQEISESFLSNLLGIEVFIWQWEIWVSRCPMEKATRKIFHFACSTFFP